MRGGDREEAAPTLITGSAGEMMNAGRGGHDGASPKTPSWWGTTLWQQAEGEGSHAHPQEAMPTRCPSPPYAALACLPAFPPSTDAALGVGGCWWGGTMGCAGPEHSSPRTSEGSVFPQCHGSRSIQSGATTCCSLNSKFPQQHVHAIQRPHLPECLQQREHAVWGHVFLNSEFPRQHVHATQGPRPFECLQQHEHAIQGARLPEFYYQVGAKAWTSPDAGAIN